MDELEKCSEITASQKVTLPDRGTFKKQTTPTNVTVSLNTSECPEGSEFNETKLISSVLKRIFLNVWLRIE